MQIGEGAVGRSLEDSLSSTLASISPSPGTGEAGRGCLVYLLATPAGGLALVVHPGDGPATADGGPRTATVTPVWLDGLTEEWVDALLLERSGGQITGGYLVGQLSDPGWLVGHLPQVVERLAGQVMTPLLDALTEVAGDGPLHLILIPAGRLALLPLHAGVTGPASSNLTITYAPSAIALGRARERRAERSAHPPYLLGVGNPLPDGARMAELRDRMLARLEALPPALGQNGAAVRALLARPAAELAHAGRAVLAAVVALAASAAPPQAEAASAGATPALPLLAALLQEAIRWPQSLPHAQAELADICALLPDRSRPLYGAEATVDAFTRALPQATLLHFACHGAFDPADPPASGLALADGQLRLRDLHSPDFQGLARARLAVLSACQTAISDFRDLRDESIGLPAAFLQAGVPGVVGSLWPVADHSTRLLIGRFYAYWLGEDYPPAQALAAAQHWLRTASRDDLGAYYESFLRMPPDEAQSLQAEMLLAGSGEERPYANPYYWAGFTFHGV